MQAVGVNPFHVFPASLVALSREGVVPGRHRREAVRFCGRGPHRGLGRSLNIKLVSARFEVNSVHCTVLYCTVPARLSYLSPTPSSDDTSYLPKGPANGCRQAGV